MELKDGESLAVVEFKINPNNIKDYDNWLRDKRFVDEMLEAEQDYEKEYGKKLKHYRRLLNVILIDNNILLHYFACGATVKRFKGLRDGGAVWE
mgnify:CR=1 FL=1